MKKAAALAIMMVIALAASQPAVAGVGGCRTLGCPGGWNLEVVAPQEQTPSVLDTVGGALPLDVYAFLKALFTQKGNDGGTVIEAPQTPTT